jgi:TfoX/Sxy family transcriptional regulator of competence genes
MASTMNLVERVRKEMSAVPRVSEKKMFGSVAFMVNDKMCVSARADRVMCRIAPELHDDAIADEHCRTVIMRGRPIRGYVYIDAEGVKAHSELSRWIGLALEYNKQMSSR